MFAARQSALRHVAHVCAADVDKTSLYVPVLLHSRAARAHPARPQFAGVGVAFYAELRTPTAAAPHDLEAKQAQHGASNFCSDLGLLLHLCCIVLFFHATCHNAPPRVRHAMSTGRQLSPHTEQTSKLMLLATCAFGNGDCRPNIVATPIVPHAATSGPTRRATSFQQNART